MRARRRAQQKSQPISWWRAAYLVEGQHDNAQLAVGRGNTDGPREGVGGELQGAQPGHDPQARGDAPRERPLRGVVGLGALLPEEMDAPLALQARRHAVEQQHLQGAGIADRDRQRSVKA